MYPADVGTYLNNTLSGIEPVIIGDRVLSRKWSRGNTFSLDGVHPAYTGQALIANYLIKELNRTFQLNAPLIDLEQTLATDPYMDKDGDGWVPGPGYPNSGQTELLFLFTDPNDADPSIPPASPSAECLGYDIPDSFSGTHRNAGVEDASLFAGVSQLITCHCLRNIDNKTVGWQAEKELVQQ